MRDEGGGDLEAEASQTWRKQERKIHRMEGKKPQGKT